MASLMPLQKSITPWKVGVRGVLGRVSSTPVPRREGLRQGVHMEQWVAVMQKPPGHEVDPVPARQPIQGREMRTAREGH